MFSFTRDSRTRFSPRLCQTNPRYHQSRGPRCAPPFHCWGQVSICADGYREERMRSTPSPGLGRGFLSRRRWSDPNWGEWWWTFLGLRVETDRQRFINLWGMTALIAGSHKPVNFVKPVVDLESDLDRLFTVVRLSRPSRLPDTAESSSLIPLGASHRMASNRLSY